ncbi:E3 ubiquitin-protein ligase ZSWIM2 [Fasciola gigantica]|uniref:E3 ubiquitin-protein ligase ZSWIM2 n=1 Tax=Fasciola gigantica TaxID=46835 RepID=A0A504YR60_FASGI|nr:E3 ubiquitin-protein ligase ZSWIM2 [Fasciola gigantica]
MNEHSYPYQVHIGQEHTCTCSEFKARQELCIHICWVMLKRFKVDQNNSITWQLGLVEREIQDVLDGKYSFTVQPKSTLEKPEDEPKNEGEIRQRPICPGDICAICQDELLTEQRHPVTYCRNGCGNSVHIRCMRVWTDHQRKQKSINLSENVPCPICREEFGQLGMLMREITENIHPREAKPENRRTVVVAPTVQSIQSTVRTYHPSTTCLSCGMSPVYGNIYRCQLCDEKLDQLGSTFMCAPCYRQGKHPEHDAFMYREAPNGKWFAVAVNRCIPHNLMSYLKIEEQNSH